MVDEVAPGHALDGNLVQLRAGEEAMQKDCSDSKSASDSDDDSEGVVWARSRVQAKDYIRRRGI